MPAGYVATPRELERMRATEGAIFDSKLLDSGEHRPTHRSTPGSSTNLSVARDE